MRRRKECQSVSRFRRAGKGVSQKRRVTQLVPMGAPTSPMEVPSGESRGAVEELVVFCRIHYITVDQQRTSGEGEASAENCCTQGVDP